jgi:hypothetical protein
MEKRDRQVKIMMTQSEVEEMKRRAGREPFSSYCRRLVLGEDITSVTEALRGYVKAGSTTVTENTSTEHSSPEWPPTVAPKPNLRKKTGMERFVAEEEIEAESAKTIVGDSIEDGMEQPSADFHENVVRAFESSEIADEDLIGRKLRITEFAARRCPTTHPTVVPAEDVAEAEEFEEPQAESEWPKELDPATKAKRKGKLCPHGTRARVDNGIVSLTNPTALP